MERKTARPRLMGRDRIVALMLLAMAVIMVILGVLLALGLRLVFGDLYLFMPVIMLLTLVGWGFSALARRIANPRARLAAAVAMVVVMLLLALLALTAVSVAGGLIIPRKYADITGDGGKLVVMRSLDPDEGRISARREARLAADPEGNPETVVEDWGYVYRAYGTDPMGIFYRKNTLLEGEVCIGYASKAELMVEWEDDIAHFFIKNPETGDGGEMRARG